ncbi:MAG TPA: ABC-F family ATP-binding cassette domain-containing protein [Verrucomicrobiae bacterium]|jgi:ATP-binding cassette subfamily F protein uup|nr:ABC-F family ATP-binding cassette domain-containing protein [Verrucomicrobiae bacterium]
MSTIIAATDVVVRHGDRTVLDRITLGIQEGERIGLVGRNGCGKTTFLKILAVLQLPDSGEVTRQRHLVVSYLPQDIELDTTKNVHENVRVGAQHVLDLITEFEALPHDSKRHEELEQRILALDGWTVDRRSEVAMAHLGCPPGERSIESLSGGEKRRVAMARAVVSRPDFLMLDEPTNHLDPESIEWLAEFLENFSGTFLIVTHDRYFLDRTVNRMIELSDGKFFSHEGNYTDYLLAKAERQEADAVIEHKRQMFLKKELAWVRQGPRAQRSKQKNRFERYYETAAQDGPLVEEDIELVIPPPPQLGNRTVDVNGLGMELGGKKLFSGFNFTFENGRRVGVCGRNGLGKSTLLRIVIGQLQPTEGTTKTGQLTKFNYVDQGRLQLNDQNTVLDEMAEGREFVQWGDAKISVRSYLKRFLFADDRIMTQVRKLSGGERSRLLLARILKNGGNFLILDEPTNDLDLPTLRVLEEALIAFPGVVCVVSHDRYFLNRVCTDILAFEGDGKIHHSVGDYDYYLEKKQRASRPAAPAVREELNIAPGKLAAPATTKPRKMSFKETRELEGMENLIRAVETEIARIEILFATPDFHRTHAKQTDQLVADLAAAKSNLAKLYLRWEELEALKADTLKR